MAQPSVFPSFKDYLNHLATESGNNTTEYGLYLKEIAAFQRLSHYSSTVVFLIDYSSMTNPFMSSNTIHVAGHPHEAFEEGGLEFSLAHNLDFSYLNKDIFHDRERLFSENPDIDLGKVRFSMAFRLKYGKGCTRNFLQRHTITEMATQTLPLGIMGFGRDITGQSPASRVFHQKYQVAPTAMHETELNIIQFCSRSFFRPANIASKRSSLSRSNRSFFSWFSPK